MYRQKFVEYRRIFREFNIPTMMYPFRTINGQVLRGILNDPLFIARSVDTVVYHKVRATGIDGMGTQDLTKIMHSFPIQPKSRSTRATVKLGSKPLDVRPFQGKKIYNFLQFVCVMRDCVKNGKYIPDDLLPRECELRWENNRRVRNAKNYEKLLEKLPPITPEEEEIIKRLAFLIHGEENGNLNNTDFNSIYKTTRPVYQANTTDYNPEKDNVKYRLDASDTAEFEDTIDVSDYDVSFINTLMGETEFLSRRDQMRGLWMEERPFLGIPTMYDRCMDQFCHDLLIATVPFDYLYESGNHAMPLRSVYTAHLAIAGHVKAMVEETGQAPTLLELGLYRLRDHMPRERAMNLLREVLLPRQSTELTRNLLKVIESLVHRGVRGDDKPRSYGLCTIDMMTRIIGNMYLHPLDAYLISRGFRHVRYFDQIVLILPDTTSVDRIIREMVFFVEDALGVPAALHRTSVLEPGECGVMLRYSVMIDPETKTYGCYLPERTAKQIKENFVQLCQKIKDEPNFDIDHPSEEIARMTRKIIGALVVFPGAKADDPIVHRLCNSHKEGRISIRLILQIALESDVKTDD
jgi:hypothetical protein